MLERLDEVRVKADLIDHDEKLKIQPFSGGGQYLVHYPVLNWLISG